MTPADLDRVEREFKVARGNSGHDGLAYWATRRAPALIATIRRQQEALEMAEGLISGWMDWELSFTDEPKKHPWINKAKRLLAQLRAVKADGGAK